MLWSNVQHALTIQLLFKRNTASIGSALISAVLAITAIAIPLSMMNTAKNVPPIHDISTDLMNPPQFVAIALLRADAPKPLRTWAGSRSILMQIKAL
ncbi:hypothetical protein ACPESL_10915 [Psychrobacter pocilloporae]|uniref:hypothetical protein n=1 Tax=Psychrobacter pocilloporae TaxID=1775882 RepID=UPI003C2C90E2